MTAMQSEVDALDAATRIISTYLEILSTVAGIRWDDDDDANVRLALRGIVAAAKGD
jgi:hypothetical protein